MFHRRESPFIILAMLSALPFMLTEPVPAQSDPVNRPGPAAYWVQQRDDNARYGDLSASVLPLVAQRGGFLSGFFLWEKGSDLGYFGGVGTQTTRDLEYRIGTTGQGVPYVMTDPGDEDPGSLSDCCQDEDPG